MTSYGKLDSVVHLAGVRGDEQLLRVTEGAFDRAAAPMLRGALLLTQASARQMKAQGGGGRIVLTTASAALLGSFGQTSFAAAAAGVWGLMRTASIELQRLAIFVNAVAPVAKTRLTEDLPMFEHVSTMTPEHVAPAYLFFASDLSSDLAGNVLSVAGGRIALARAAEGAARFQEAEGGIWSAEGIRGEWSVLARAQVGG